MIGLSRHTQPLSANGSIFHLLETQAERRADAIAIAAPERDPLFFSRLYLQAREVVHALNSLGIGRNDRVALVLPNGPEMAAAFVSVACSATAAPLNPAYRANEFDFYLSDLNAKALIVRAGIGSPAIAVAQKHSIPIIELSPGVDTAGIFTLRGQGEPCESNCGFAEPEDIALVLHTSGTTSRPKMVRLTHSNLLASGCNIAATLQLTETDRCLNVMPLFHIHGLVGAVLSSIMAGSSVVCTSGFDAEKFFAWLEEFRPTWYTAVPTMHQAVLSCAGMHKEMLRRCSLRFIRSSSAPLPLRVMQKLEELFHVPVIEAYGMTEASHQIASNPLPPRTRKARSVGLPTGVEVAVLDQGGNVLASGETGEIVIRGASVLSAYGNNCEARKESFQHDWFRTGDQGYLDREGYIFLTGRFNEVINRGGEKISPAEVDEVLKEHPAVFEAVTFAVPHATLGHDIAAAVVLDKHDSVNGAEIQRFAGTRLADFKVPRQVLIVNEIPKGATGKIQRVGLAEKLGLVPASGEARSVNTDSSPPQTPVEKTLTRIWSLVLGADVGIHDNFFHLGGDSIHAARIISRIRASTGAELPFSAFFETPTVAAMAGTIEMANQELRSPKALPLPKDGTGLPSDGQEALWFLDQLHPGNPAYNRPLFIRLHGQLNVKALERSLNEIVRRHAVLRSSFPAEDGQPSQRINAAQPFSLPVTDMSSLPEAEREAQARKAATEEARRPFDLARGPLSRTRLLRLNDELHLLLVTLHHIVSDGWSSEIFRRELVMLYEAFSAGRPSPLPELSIQYLDFARWQRESAQDETVKNQLAYWKRQLDGSWPILSLPMDRPRPPIQTFNGASQSFTLPTDLTNSLKALSRREGATLFMTLLAAFKTLLHRYSGQEDIIVGTPFAGRNQTHTEELIGLFINTLPLRTDLSGNPAFRELLARVRTTSLEAHAHQDIPFRKIMAELQLRRDASRTAAYRVLFHLRNYPRNVGQFGSLFIEEYESEIGTSLFDLSLAIREEKNGLECRFDYSTDLFDAARVARMGGHFQTLLQGIIANPQQRLSDIPILTEAERQLLVEWNDTKREYPKEKCVHELFEAQVKRTPDAVAVVFKDNQLTYRELNGRANQLAHHLQRSGVGPEVLVGICMERSLEMVIGLLGILKAGGAYVPLDPAYPQERLALMLDDSRPLVLLTQQKFIEDLPMHGAHVICLDTGWETIGEECEESFVSEATPENLAYIIYTSGTTGAPKGVMTQHRSLVHYTKTAAVEFSLAPGDRVLQFASLSFDAAAEEIFPSLITGAALVLRTDAMLDTVPVFLHKCRKWKLTVLDLPTAYWHELAAQLDQASSSFPQSLRLVIIGGERALRERLVMWHRQVGQRIQLLNTYGPTETTVVATMRELSTLDDLAPATQEVPIGRAIPNVQTYLLDGHLQPVPIGVPGEVHIGGIGLARGYLNCPDLSAEKFIPNPFSAEPGARLYKTGDVARYLPDGNIEFLGRVDTQVKIRGFRIELGEVETVLSQHPAVQQAVVLAREDIRREKQLDAYLVPRTSAPTTNDLRSFLKQKLPEYMVPSAFVFLDALPLTPNGKVDRRALPAPDQARPELVEAFVAPRTPLEETLAAIWAEVLKLERVGVCDNFFDLGGHSLLATQVISRVLKAFHVELTVRTLFENPTVADLAAQITRQDIQTNVEKTEDRYPLSPMQQGMLFHSLYAPGSGVYIQQLSCALCEDLNVSAFKRAWDRVVERHPVLRTSFRWEGLDEPVQDVHRHVTLPWQKQDWRSLSAREREHRLAAYLKADRQRDFDFAKAPLMRMALFRLDDADYRFIWTSHHVLFDGRSRLLILKELFSFYDAFCRDHDLLLPQPHAYRHHIDWLRTQDFSRSESFWRRKLSGFIAATPLLVDHVRSPESYEKDPGTQGTRLSEELTSALLSLAQDHQLTPNTLLQGAWALLLSRYSGEEDVVFGATRAGRHTTVQGAESTVGLLINTVPIRVRVSSESLLLPWLKDIRAQWVEMRDFEHTPLVKIQGWSQIPSGNPLFESLLVFENYQLDSALRRQEGDWHEREFHLIGTPSYPLTVNGYLGQDLFLKIEYDRHRFNDATVARMLGHLHRLLEGMVADPTQRLSDLSLLTEGERQRLLVEWNDTKKDYPKDKCIHELFAAQAERTPEATAAIFEDRQLTYQELNARANQLAHYLQKLGVGPEVAVGICMERSLEVVVGILGILKAGGGYVPLEPTYPQERLAFTLEDSQAPVLLTQGRLMGRLPDHKGKTICLDTDWEVIARESKENPVGKARPENLAYAIYTSGSTGQPKGVLIEHQQILNYVKGIWDRCSLEPGATFAMVQPLSFDSSQTVLFPSLISGGCLHLISEEKASDPQGLSDYFSRSPIDLLKITPSHLAALQTSFHPERVLPRRWLVIGGEAARGDWVEKLQAIARCSIFNHYGPTEATVGILTYQVQTEQTSHSSSTIPIGRPLSNTQAYLLDRHLQPVPIGVPGELHIGGSCLARGYLNRPDLTAEKFIPNPFSDELGARLYKTGDVARYLPDGNIEFLGRVDHQVKLRGFRIELGEIEAVLRQHPAVRETVVVAPEDTLGHQHLIAYVVPSPKHTPTIAGRPRYQLPNKLTVAQLNKNETDYLYSEIFERQAYLKHGITINDGDCVFDVGANIGLFMLFANQICKNAKIYAFEPNPAIFEILSANASLYGSNAKLFKCGLSNEAKTATFTFFPGFSLLSGFYADPEAEKQVVKTFITNQRKTGLSETAELLEQVDDILDERFSPQTFPAQLRTLSSIIEEGKIECIDLLKINVEKSELDVLLGIKNEEWKKIKQIVLEVDVKENLDRIVSLLERQGYDYVVEQDVLLENTQLRYIYAIRPSRERTLIREQAEGTHIRPIADHNDPLLSIGELKNFLSQKLPEYMVPSAFVFLDALPLAPNGKVDRRALPVPDQSRPELKETFVAPRTPAEKVIAEIWAQVLKLDKVGVHDNFFDLGGHSLLATQVVSRLREAFHEEIPLRNLFEGPTVAGLAERIGAARQEPPSLTSSSILPLPCEKECPQSFSQQRFWFLNQLEPNSFVYNVTRGFRLTGSLKVKALEQTLGEIVRRHETLRTTFSMRNGEPVQVVAEQWSVKLPIIDLTDRPDADLTAEVQRLFDNEFRRPFNLSSDLMLRATLLRLNDKEHVLFLSIHHIAFDHWSIEVLYRELLLIYKAFSTGMVSPLPELPIQYKHYAIWQRKMLQDAALENDLAYWKQQLRDSPPVLHLPTDQPRPPVRTFRGARLGLVVPRALADALKALSREAGVTLFMTLLAAFKILLHRLTGEDDIVVGSPIAGRDRSETEDLIGLFLNTLVLRTNLSGNPTFRELLTRVRDVALGAYDHRDLPFEKLVEELKPKRDLSHTPLFQVFFNMYNFKEPKLDLDGLSVWHLDLREPVSMFDLTLYVRERDDATHLSVLYNADLFHPDTASRMLGHFQTLLQGIVANPDQRLSSLSILTDAEKQQQLLGTWNNTEKNCPENQCIHQLFEAQVERSPDSVAVVFEDEQLSYRELNQRANQVAHYLRELGVGPEVPVGFCMERSLEMVVGLLGILKAGGAYVPLDPEYPKARLAYMLADAQADFLLTRERLLENFPEFKGQALCLDRDRGLFDRKQEENPDTTLEPDNLAYVIYTSGSTGKPKGVLGYHRGVLNYLSYLHETYNLNRADTVLQLPSLSFDASVRDLIGPLTAGARLIIVNDFDAKQPVALLSKIKEHGVTCLLSIVPTLLNGLVEAGRRTGLLYDSIRLILVSGEALPMTTCQKAEEVFGQRAWIVNQYGPTESTLTCSYHRVLKTDTDRGIAPLGKPIPNSRIYILDGYLNLVPTGIPGELHIGGIGLTRGYMSSPDLTAEKFIPDPFSVEPGARLYKTGDLARYMLEGNIEFLGRVDHQVKIRGFRIELGEIEVVLTQHPAVQQAAAIVREDVPGDNRLVAYIVLNKHQAAAIDDLRNFLKSKLPEYMVPSAFVVLDALPLTPNRKVDRRALPAPESSRPGLKSTFVGPRNPVEKRLLDIWAEVLRLEQIGIHDDFFELGGHSLLATQVISRVRDALQLEVPLRALFENPTVASLAAQITEAQARKPVPKKMADALADLEALSDEEAQRLLAQESSKEI